MTDHKLTITGGIARKHITGTCSCGQFSLFMNMPHRGNSKNYREFVTSKFKAHKSEKVGA